ncbi:MAG: hypothetical protein NT040_12640 [Bacteroidetes bacterium]|nr:hypothetical protein [Bacteroidota bacterium]
MQQKERTMKNLVENDAVTLVKLSDDRIPNMIHTGISNTGAAGTNPTE